MTRSHKRLIIIVGCVVTAIVLAIAVLLFGFGQNQSDSADSTNKKLVADAATKLAVELTSGDQAVYKAAWSHTNVPPMPLAGTQIIIGNAQYSEAYSQVNVEVKMPGKGVVRSIIHLEPAGNGWRVHKIEEVK
jgi:hypothetical protein